MTSINASPQTFLLSSSSPVVRAEKKCRASLQTNALHQRRRILRSERAGGRITCRQSFGNEDDSWLSTSASSSSSSSSSSFSSSFASTMMQNVATSACALSVAAALVASGISSPPLALAELNAREANQGGEFNRGSAQQFGGYDLRATNVSEKYGTDLRLSNFTAAEMRDSKLVGAKLNGAYLMKAVAANADFTDADLSDALMDRGVFVNANFTNAILARVVLTSSDLNGAIITNADFSDALLDNTMQMKLCKIATGTNPTTGVNTRKSLNCTGGRGNVGSPSRYMTEEDAKKPEAQFEASRFSAYSTK